MRTVIDLPYEMAEGLTLVAKKEKKTKTMLILDAIKEYLKHQIPVEKPEAFGLWASRNIDALAYEQSLRDEWEN